MLRTKITELIGIKYPVTSAPMTLHSGGQLAAAVSAAGGLGGFGGINPDGPDYVREQVRYIRSQTDNPFYIGFITHLIPEIPQNFDAALEEKPPVVFFSFGDPKPWLTRAKDAGATVICQVQSLEDAAEAVAAGADVLQVQGSAAGGHTGRMNLPPFLSHIVDRYPDIPVMAAGGISTGRALAAVLAGGAEGASMGTAFLATPENVEVPDAFKQHVVRSDGQDTTLSPLYDVLGGGAWPRDIVGRVYNNPFVQRWDGRDADIQKNLEELASDAAEAWAKHDVEGASVYMGQSAVSVGAMRDAADVLRDICGEAERLLGNRLRELGI